MTVNLQKDAPAGDRVGIHSSPGKVEVTSPALFGAPGDAPIHALIERLFQSSAVQAVALDPERTAVEIRFDQSVMNVARALQTFSSVLGEPAPSGESRPTHAGTLLRPYLERIPGKIRLVERRRRPEGELTTAALAEMEEAAGAEGSKASTRAAVGLRHAVPAESTVVVEDLIVEFDPVPGRIAGEAAEVTPLQSHVTQPWAGEVIIGGVRRMANLAAAGGCFVMSIVGFVTPGIPTVPFVLATGYFLARSSPRLNERFRRSRFFGTMVSDYQDHGGLRWSTKFKMILFTVGLMVVTVVIAGATLPLLIFVGIMGITGIYLLGRIPTVKGGPHPAEANLASA
jgi:uncharacterized membrane protein YbaN (DUF454 family)